MTRRKIAYINGILVFDCVQKLACDSERAREFGTKNQKVIVVSSKNEILVVRISRKVQIRKCESALYL